MSTKRPKKRNKQTVAAQRARYQKEQEELAKAKQGKRKRDAKEIAVIVISVIVAVSLMLPSLAQIFAQPQQTETLPTTVEGYQEKYQPIVDGYEEQLEADPNNAQAELGLANTYYEWGSYARMFAGDEEFQAEVTRVFTEAENAYAKYLEIVGNTDSDEAKQAAVSKALCASDLGNTIGAIDQLQKLADDTNYAPAWANLGMLYQSQEGGEQAAIEAYQKGIEADPDGSLGVKDYCEQQIEAIESADDESADDTGDTAESSGDTADTSENAGGGSES